MKLELLNLAKVKVCCLGTISEDSREGQEFEGWISYRLVLGHKPEIGEYLQTTQVSPTSQWPLEPMSPVKSV